MEYDVSVIIPAYNAEKYIKRSLDSVVAQTMFDRMQVIVVDDGSTDTTGNIADMYADKYINIECIHQGNGGESTARNVGLEKTLGKYIGFVDADDWVEADYYQYLYDVAVRCNADIVCSGFTLNRGYDEMLKNSLTDQKLVLNHQEGLIAFLKSDIDVHTCTKLFCKTSINCIRFNTDIRIGPDRWFTFDSIMQVDCVVLVDGSGYHYYMNSNSVMHNIELDDNLENLNFANYMMNAIRSNYPNLLVYAECLEVIIKCRLLGDLAMMDRTNEILRLWNLLKQDIDHFELRKAYRHMCKKHFISLMIAKFSPWLYAKLRSNEYFKYKR